MANPETVDWQDLGEITWDDLGDTITWGMLGGETNLVKNGIESGFPKRLERSFGSSAASVDRDFDSTVATVSR